jgi:hypothetical protein
MSIKAAGNADISQETGMAMEKSELMNEVFGVETVIE